MNFKKIISENKNNVQNIIRLITNENNEDLEQEVYIKVWQNQDKYEEQGSFKAWIGTIAKNFSKDYLKSAKRKNENNTVSDDDMLYSLKDTRCTPETLMTKTERQKMIIKAIDSLKPKFKEVILLCEIDGLSYEEISKKIKTPIGTVKSRLFNAKKELAILLKDLL